MSWWASFRMRKTGCRTGSRHCHSSGQCAPSWLGSWRRRHRWTNGSKGSRPSSRNRGSRTRHRPRRARCRICIRPDGRADGPGLRGEPDQGLAVVDVREDDPRIRLRIPLQRLIMTNSTQPMTADQRHTALIAPMGSQVASL